ncbi:MAG: ribosome rescue protein RqcH [Candidatus Heimdallarchaeaceae archaeon]
MKSALSGLDIYALVNELRPKVVGSWINNAYSIGNKLVILRFRKSTENPFELIIEIGKRFHITKYIRPKPQSPNNKIMMVRKHIKNLPVTNFYQRGLDRVIVFEIAYKDGHYKLVVELFGEGNIILVSPENKILMAYKYRKMRDRDVHPGKEFEFPPMAEENILSLSLDEIREKILSSKGKIVVILNQILGLGPLYSKDILLKAEINKKTIEDLSEDEKNKIIKEIRKLKEIIENKNFEYITYKDEDQVVEVSPIPLKKYEDLTKIPVESFNDALDEFFSLQEEEPDISEDRTKISGKLAKLEKNLRDQELHLERLKKQEIEEKKKGDLIYANFTLLDELVKTILNARKNGVPWDEIKEKLQYAKEKGIPAAMCLEKLTPSKKEISVKLQDEEGNDIILNFDFTKTIAEVANEFYEKAKKARRKIPGAVQAIERTKLQIKQIKETEVGQIEERIATPKIKQRPRKWYEKFHWFMCGDKIIIGGTDAKSNERILKTYLEENDLFFHADVHGAPYVVIKNGQGNVDEQCLREAAIFALNYSSLWKDKKLAGDVFYVLPDQVSLTPPSGQYLAKGSVMIYGEKRYLKNVEIQHAIGIKIFPEYAQVIGGPAGSIKAQTETYLEIRPGDVPKGKLAKEIKQKLLSKIPEKEKYKVEVLDINEFVKFIPGDAMIVEKK